MDLIQMSDSTGDEGAGDFSGTSEKIRASTNSLGISAATFAKAMSQAFSDATTGGKQFDDVLKQLALRLSNMAVASAFQPIGKGLSAELGKLLGGIFGDESNSSGKSGSRSPGFGGNVMSAISNLTPFASGGVIGTSSYFPLSPSGLGLAGEAGPEAIMPLTRGSDGRLGVAASNAGPPVNVTVQIAAPDVDSFRRSEAYITGQIARAVARGQRSF